MNNCNFDCNEERAPKIEYKAFPHLFNLVGLRARFKLRNFYNDVNALEAKLKKENEVAKIKKPLDMLLHSDKHEERKDNSINKSTCVDSKVLARYHKKSFAELYKDECAIAAKLIESERKVIDYYNKNNFIQFKHNKLKLKQSSNTSSQMSTLTPTTSTRLAPITRTTKQYSQCKATTVPPSKLTPRLEHVGHHKRLRNHKSNSLSFFHRNDHLNKSIDDIKQLQGIDKEGNVIDANLAIKPIFKLTTHAMINTGVFKINLTRNHNHGLRARKLSEPMEGFNFDYVKFASYDSSLSKEGNIQRRYSM